MIKFKNQRGFTLIELLVVIAIIGILTTLMTVNLTQAQARARDGRRKTDLKVIAQGLEMYYSQYASYPAIGNGTSRTFDFAYGSLTDGTDTFIKSMPKDPRNTANTSEYYYCTNSSAPYRNFNLYANLENNNDVERFCNSASWSATTCDTASLTCGEGSSVTSAGTGTTSFTTVQTNSDYTVSEP